MKKTFCLVLATLAAAVSLAAPRKAADITVSGYTGSTTLANFPVLVRISPERISGFSYADCAAGGAPAKTVVTEITAENVSQFVGGTISAAGGINTQTNPYFSGTDGTVRWLRGPEAGTMLILQ